MHPTVSALERHALIDPSETNARLVALPYSSLCHIAEDLHEAMFTSARREDPSPQESSLEALNLLASSSIRGDRCAGCWPDKLEILSRYAALYADRVVVPYQLGIPAFDTEEQRVDFAARVIGLMSVRELMEADVLRPVLPEFHFCSACAKNARSALKQVEAASMEFVDRHIEEFRFIYRPVTEDISYVEIQGPERYVGHGGGTLFRKRPKWAPRRIGSYEGRPGKVLSCTVVRRAHLLRSFVRGFGSDLVFQQLYGRRYGTKYLTDLPGEAEFFSAASESHELAAKTAALCARLTHTVPLLRDVSLSTVLRIRREDPEAFLLYRQALGKIVRDNLNGREIGANEAEQLYFDVLQPELVKLARQAKATSRASHAKVIARTVVPAATITLGVFGGLLPASLAELARVIGATALLTQAGEALLGVRDEPLEIRNHNLYFLLQLAKAHGSIQ